MPSAEQSDNPPKQPEEKIQEVEHGEIPPSSGETSSPTQIITPKPGTAALNKQHTKPNTQHNEENMEVHHHTHPGHHKKKWTDYFWEFLMLFLAVFCGFLAEYQLEHKIEKDREKQFITSLAADLQDDVKSLDAMIVIESRGIASLDTLMHLLNSPEIAKQNGDQLYYVARMGPRSNPFGNNSRTFDQLRNSGGFRLITNTEASNNIMNYYNQFSPVRLLEDNYNREFDNYKRVAAKILDPAILRRQENELGEILTSTDNPALQTYDAGLLKELGFHTLQMNGSRRSKIGMLENLKKTAVHLKSYLQEQYDFK